MNTHTYTIISQMKWLWIVICLGVYTCAISGLIFDIIRNPPTYYANPNNGQVMFFYPQSGSQFVVEGFIIGFLNVGCSVALIYLLNYGSKASVRFYICGYMYLICIINLCIHKQIFPCIYMSMYFILVCMRI
jgi:hypothetical protein